ncbi:MAG: hypothetical protein AB1394_14700 [Bacteroidota bacterium]|jgi:hypothetical protein
MSDWKKEFNVCDKEGKILEMNHKSAEVFKDDGGFGLFECHSDQVGCNYLEIAQRGIDKCLYDRKKGN